MGLQDMYARERDVVRSASFLQTVKHGIKFHYEFGVTVISSTR